MAYKNINNYFIFTNNILNTDLKIAYFFIDFKSSNLPNSVTNPSAILKSNMAVAVNFKTENNCYKAEWDHVIRIKLKEWREGARRGSEDRTRLVSDAEKADTFSSLW